MGHGSKKKTSTSNHSVSHSVIQLVIRTIIQPVDMDTHAGRKYVYTPFNLPGGSDTPGRWTMCIPADVHIYSLSRIGPDTTDNAEGNTCASQRRRQDERRSVHLPVLRAREGAMSPMVYCPTFHEPTMAHVHFWLCFPKVY